jgi:hypothetical protein
MFLTYCSRVISPGDSVHSLPQNPFGHSHNNYYRFPDLILPHTLFPDQVPMHSGAHSLCFHDTETLTLYEEDGITNGTAYLPP